MYLRPAHTEHHIPTLYRFIRDNPLGVLTTAIKSENYPLLQSSHIPWVLDAPDSSSTSSEPQPAKLRGHMARANPHAKALSEAAAALTTGGSSGTKCAKLKEEVMVLFTSSVHHYVTPKFYVETKPSTGKVVPTWDYSAVQCYGLATVFYDSSAAETGEYLAKQIDDLSKQSEEKIFGYDGQEGRSKAWNVNEAPESYVNLLKKAIIGVEIEITRIHGKWKMSQELAKGDREGVIKGFEQLGTETGNDIARTVKERGELKDAGQKQ
jgi:transcriptional regulator